MGDAHNMTTLSIQKEDRERLSELALELGLVWGKRGNATQLVEMIARRQYGVTLKPTWSDSRLRALVIALNALTDSGQQDMTQEIVELLLERPELGSLQRLRLEKLAKRPANPFNSELNEFLTCKQPFHVLYEEARGSRRTFSVRYGEIHFREKRQYLECWVEEKGEKDIPELFHNRALRLDRLVSMAIDESGEWRTLGLDSIWVKMHLFGDLVDAYEGNAQEDVKRIEGENGAHFLEVRRRVTNSFWFLREILPHGDRCVILEPQSIRQKFIDELERWCKRYGLALQHSNNSSSGANSSHQ